MGRTLYLVAIFLLLLSFTLLTPCVKAQQDQTLLFNKLRSEVLYLDKVGNYNLVMLREDVNVLNVMSVEVVKFIENVTVEGESIYVGDSIGFKLILRNIGATSAYISPPYYVEFYPNSAVRINGITRICIPSPLKLNPREEVEVIVGRGVCDYSYTAIGMGMVKATIRIPYSLDNVTWYNVECKVEFQIYELAKQYTLGNIVGVFFYPWYSHYRRWSNQIYNPPYTWASHYLPDLLPGFFMPSIELYDSSNDAVIFWQLSLLRRAHVGYIIASWWGENTYEDYVFRKLISISTSSLNPHPMLKWCILYEKEGYGNPSVDQLVADLEYVVSKYGVHDNYLKIDSRPVVFVYASGDDASDYARRWYEAKQKLNSSIFLVLKVFNGYEKYVNYADLWYQYAPAIRYEAQKPYYAFISPGFWRIGESTPQLPRNLTEFKLGLKKLISENVTIKTIQTWNEWSEGSQVEPGQRILAEILQYKPLEPSYGFSFIDAIGTYTPSLYTYNPWINIDSSVVEYYSSTIVEGKGFPPRTNIDIYVDTMYSSSVTTNDNGFFSLPIKIQDLGIHSIVASDHSGNTAANLVYCVKSSTTISMDTSAREVVAGWNVTFSGVITPEISGLEVDIQVRKSSNSWSTVSTVTTKDGRFTSVWVPKEECVYEVRAYHKGSKYTSESYSNTITVKVLKPAEFKISLSINPVKVRIGKPVNISVAVKNIGDVKGAYLLTLKINGSVESTEKVVLEKDESKVVVFQVVRGKPGSYRAEVNGVVGVFRVQEAPLIMPPPPDVMIRAVAVAIAIIILAMAIYVILRMRRARKP